MRLGICSIVSNGVVSTLSSAFSTNIPPPSLHDETAKSGYQVINYTIHPEKLAGFLHIYLCWSSIPSSLLLMGQSWVRLECTFCINIPPTTLGPLQYSILAVISTPFFGGVLSVCLSSPFLCPSPLPPSCVHHTCRAPAGPCGFATKIPPRCTFPPPARGPGVGGAVQSGIP